MDRGKLREAVIAPPTPFDAALANAVYKMVERADELQADAVIFVRMKVSPKPLGSVFSADFCTDFYF